MSLDKAIEHHKEKRQMYRGSKAIDYTCRNHGSCEWCRQNRKHKFRDKESDSMKKVITYIADDDTEFETEEECYAYEHRFDGVLDSVIFLDGDFVVIPWDLEKVYDNFIYLVIRDAEKAWELFKALHDYEYCFVRPDGYKDGDILEWDGDAEDYINLREKLVELSDKIKAIEKAVNAG